jgi:hypothetical protein
MEPDGDDAPAVVCEADIPASYTCEGARSVLPSAAQR